MIKKPTLLARMRQDLDDGFAMIMVLITALVVTAAATLSLTLVTQTLPQARHDQDWNAALGAAQAGVDDYRRHLNDNDTYWLNGGVDSANPAFTTGATFASTSGSSASYTYKVLTSVAQTQSSGLIRVRSTGKVNNVIRTVTVDLRKLGFLKYGYLEDISTVDPAMYPMFGQNQGYNYWNNLCGKYYYSGRSSSCSDVYFGDSDTVNGPFHSNDAVMIGGHPTFNSPIAESSWLSPSNVAVGGLVNYRQVYAGSSPNSAGYPLVYAPALNFPPANTAIQNQTNSALGGTGCLYTGPTKIVLNAAGTMTVLSPYTKSTNPGCSTSLPMTSAQTVNLPPNGVVYVQSIPASSSDPNYSNIPSCPAQELGQYPQTGDTETTYDCHVGDAFVEGTLKGQLTIASSNDIIATNNIKYLNGTTGTDVLGLVANNYVTIMHPVKCTGNQSGAQCTNLPVANGQPLNGIEIDAALLSLKHAFTLQNFNEGPPLSTAGSPSTYRHVVGAVINEYSAVDALGSSSGIVTGMIDQFDYDSRLLTQPPPYFLQPTYAPWSVTAFSEEKPGT